MKEALKQIVYLLEPVAALADGTPFEHSEVIQRCVDATEIALEALAQPVQEPDHGDELTIAYMSGVHRGKELAAQPAHVISEKEQLKQWIATTNYYRAKREYEPDAAQPAQEPVGVFCEDDDIGYVRLIPHQQMKLKAWDKLYTTPQQRPWVGLTEAQFLEATRLAENGNYLVAFVRIQEWLKEKNT